MLLLDKVEYNFKKYVIVYVVVINKELITTTRSVISKINKT